MPQESLTLVGTNAFESEAVLEACPADMSTFTDR